MTPKTYTINPELRDLLSPLSPKQFEKLEAEILADGCTNPLTIWGDTLVDGHNRYAICRKHDIEFHVNHKSFATLDDAKIWIWENQDGRRNLTRFQRVETVLKMKSAIAAQAKVRQVRKPVKSVPQKSAEQKDTRQILANFANVSHATLGQVEYILKFADGDTLNKLRWEETTINKEYRRIKKEQDATAPSKPKKSRANSKTETAISLFDEELETNDLETEPTPKRSAKKGGKPKETVTVKLKSSPKVKDQYSCGVKFEPDPDDDFFDWITEAERKELEEIRKTCPNRVVPQIHNFTIQNIPEHKPDQLLACLFSLFKVGYRKKLLYGLARKMFNEDGKDVAADIVMTLYKEFQNQ